MSTDVRQLLEAEGTPLYLAPQAGREAPSE